MVEFPETHFLKMVETVVEVVPIIDLHAFISIGLKYPNVFVAELNYHWNMVVLAIGDQPLQGAGRIFCLHQQDVPCLGHL